MIKGKTHTDRISYDIFFLHDMKTPISSDEIVVESDKLEVTSYGFQNGKKEQTSKVYYVKE